MSVDMRETIASAIAQGLQRFISFAPITIDQRATTSGCPVITITIQGEAYNLTITKARKTK